MRWLLTLAWMPSLPCHRTSRLFLGPIPSQSPDFGSPSDGDAADNADSTGPEGSQSVEDGRWSPSGVATSPFANSAASAVIKGGGPTAVPSSQPGRGRPGGIVKPLTPSKGASGSR